MSLRSTSQSRGSQSSGDHGAVAQVHLKVGPTGPMNPPYGHFPRMRNWNRHHYRRNIHIGTAPVHQFRTLVIAEKEENFWVIGRAFILQILLQ